MPALVRRAHPRASDPAIGIARRNIRERLVAGLDAAVAPGGSRKKREADGQSGFQMKKIAILQSSYIPWKGYFDIIAAVDEFILYDCVQYAKNDWRNRNQIKTAQGKAWL